MTQLARLHDLITQVGAILSAAALAGIVLLFCGEVVMRYFLNDPTSWTAAVSVYLLLATTMLMMPHLTSEAEHVAASLIEDLFSPATSRLIALAILAIACAICTIAAYFSFSEMMRAFTRGVRTTDTLYIPKWWLLGLVVYGLTSSAIHFARRFARLARSHDDQVAS